MAGSREFHVVLWGVTGFTGQLTCSYLAGTYGLPSADLKYAIAARNGSRLEAVEKSMIQSAVTQGRKEGGGITKILADVEDEASIVAMCRRAVVVIALAGPYAKCGSPVVKACADAGTHYIDCTGEMEWVLEMRKLYNEKALSTKAKIVPACGALGYVPNDVSMLFLSRMCNQRTLELQSVHMYEEIGCSLSSISGGTLRTIMDQVCGKSFGQLQKSVEPYALCQASPSAAIVNANGLPLFGVSYLGDLQMWSSRSFISPVLSNYLRWSNEIQNYPWGGRDVVIQLSALSSSIWMAILTALVSLLYPFIAFVFARLPVERFFPKSGTATFEKPTEFGTQGHIAIICKAEAKEKSEKSHKKITCKANFPYASYEFTGMALVELALATVFEETPPVFGVVSPSAAIGQAMIPRLEKQKCSFSMLSVS